MLLKGIKVLDLSTLLPGPLCSLFLEDLGAEVIKIENIEGDMMRTFDDSFFNALNRNKKSISINLKTKDGQQILRKLAKTADVLIEGFRPGKMDLLGLGYSEIKKINSAIIYCSITGYGQKGKNRNKAGHDLNYSALSGMLDVLSKQPIVPGIQIADVSSAFVAVISITASLFQRERTGKGGYIDVPIFNSAMSVIGIHLARYSATKGFNKILRGDAPCYNVYKTKDGRYVSLGAIEHKFWKSFCKCIARDDLLEKRFDSNSVRELREIFRTRRLKEWVDLGVRFDFCCEPVRSVKEVLKEKGGITNATNNTHQIVFPAIFPSFTAKCNKSPKLGENTCEILEMIGYSKGEIEGLMDKKTVYYGKP